MSHVQLIYFNAGGGHRAAAQALAQALGASARPWRVQTLNLIDLLDPQGRFRRLTGMQPEDLYNARLASGFTLGLGQELKLLQAGIRLAHGTMLQRLAAHWRATQPDLVVSLIPNFNRVLGDSLAQARPDGGVPFVTVMTDLADHPPHFWAEPGTAQHLVCGTPQAVQQALAAGLPAARVHAVSGMLLRPAFHAPPPPGFDRAAARVALGLPATQPVGLVLFGGAGSRVMKTIAQRLPCAPLVLMCGRNAALARSLRALPATATKSAPRVVVEYTPDVQHWMRLADYFIGKPGPGSLSEAVQMGLPVIVTRNAGTMPQERFNTDWVQQTGTGVVLRRFADIAAGVAQLQRHWDAHQAAVKSVHNRALFEVPALLAALVDGRRPPPSAGLTGQRPGALQDEWPVTSARNEAPAEPEPSPA